MQLLWKRMRPEGMAPSKVNPSDAGWDICACEELWLNPGDRATISTGIAVQLVSTASFYLRIADRSGNASKLGFHVLGGVVDAGYTGEIKVVLVNLGDQPRFIDRGSKIAQLIPTAILDVQTVEEVSELEIRNRGEKGFGELK